MSRQPTDADRAAAQRLLEAVPEGALWPPQLAQAGMRWNGIAIDEGGTHMLSAEQLAHYLKQLDSQLLSITGLNERLWAVPPITKLEPPE